MTRRELHEKFLDRVGVVANQIIDNAVACREAADDAEQQGHRVEWLIGRSEAHMEDGEALLEMLEQMSFEMEEAAEHHV